MSDTCSFNRRAVERFELPAMHSSVAVRCVEDEAGDLLPGHAYDIGEGGVRLELDEPLPAGTFVEVRIDLPAGYGEINATGTVIWLTDAEDDPGPRRMAVAFRAFSTDEDRVRLVKLLGRGGLPRAA